MLEGITTYYIYDGATPIAEESFSGTSTTFTALNGITADGWRARKQGSLMYDFLYDLQEGILKDDKTTHHECSGAICVTGVPSEIYLEWNCKSIHSS